jgi:ferredoxin
MKIVANRERCAGHARCASVSTELFELDDTGYIGFSDRSVPAGQESLAERGVRSCPERALKIVRDITEEQP